MIYWCKANQASFCWFMLVIFMSLSKSSMAENVSSTKSREIYRSIELFTSAEQRRSLERLRQNRGKIEVLQAEENLEKENVNEPRLFFKGFVKRSSDPIGVFIQRENKQWLSKSEWQRMGSPSELGLQIKDHSQRHELRPGQVLD